jgi:hypothetical protein
LTGDGNAIIAVIAGHSRTSPLVKENKPTIPFIKRLSISERMIFELWPIPGIPSRQFSIGSTFSDENHLTSSLNGKADAKMAPFTTS